LLVSKWPDFSACEYDHADWNTLTSKGTPSVQR
jgi:hypothetical protein